MAKRVRMEPISAFIITTALLAVAPVTRRQEIEFSKTVSKNQQRADSVTEYLLLTNLDGINRPGTLKIIKIKEIDNFPAINPRELLKREVVAYRQYSNGWNGPDTLGPTSEQIDSANSFVEATPARLPLPRPMLSSNGEIGLYWDLLDGYAEITFELDGNISFFSRTRAGKEDFQDNININNLNNNWFWSSIGSLDTLKAAT